MNQIVLMGRLTRDPELKRTAQGTAIATWTLAVDRDFQKGETDFIDCVAWRNTGEFAAQNFRKGKMMALTGRLQIREWTDKDGNKRRDSEVVVNSVYFCGDGKKAEITDSWNRIESEDSLPF